MLAEHAPDPVHDVEQGNLVTVTSQLARTAQYQIYAVKVGR